MKYQNSPNNIKSILLLFCLILQTGCRVDKDYKLIPPLGIPIRDINSDVIIYTPFGWNSNLIGEPVSIMVENNGKYPVIFSNDYGIGLFLHDNGNWVELELVSTKYTYGDIILRPAENNPLYFGSTMVEPILENQYNKAKIRIVVVGFKFIDGVKTGQKVAAYTDIWLYPKE